MPHAFLYALIVFVVAAACLLLCGLSRLLTARPPSAQVTIALTTLALCAAALTLWPAGLVCTDLLVVACGLFAGVLLGRSLGSKPSLLAFLVVAAIVDLISSRMGPTHLLVEQARTTRGIAIIQFLTLCIRWHGTLLPLIGVGDLFFFTACVIAARRLGWPGLAACLVPLAGILAALTVGLLFGPTPALPFLAVSMAVYMGIASLRKAPAKLPVQD